jgi:hypothetical protein
MTRTDIADLRARRDTALRELERVTERLDLHPTAQLRAARDQLVTAIDRLDARIETLPASS